MIVTELEKEMARYVQITKGWNGPHRFKVLCNWMGVARMREMNDFLEAAKMAEGKQHSELGWQDR